MSLFKPSNLSPNFESVTNGKPLTITFQVNSNGSTVNAYRVQILKDVNDKDNSEDNILGSIYGTFEKPLYNKDIGEIILEEETLKYNGIELEPNKDYRWTLRLYGEDKRESELVDSAVTVGVGAGNSIEAIDFSKNFIVESNNISTPVYQDYGLIVSQEDITGVLNNVIYSSLDGYITVANINEFYKKIKNNNSKNFIILRSEIQNKTQQELSELFKNKIHPKMYFYQFGINKNGSKYDIYINTNSAAFSFKYYKMRYEQVYNENLTYIGSGNLVGSTRQTMWSTEFNEAMKINSYARIMWRPSKYSYFQPFKFNTQTIDCTARGDNAVIISANDIKKEYVEKITDGNFYILLSSTKTPFDTDDFFLEFFDNKGILSFDDNLKKMKKIENIQYYDSNECLLTISNNETIPNVNNYNYLTIIYIQQEKIIQVDKNVGRNGLTKISFEESFNYNPNPTIERGTIQYLHLGYVNNDFDYDRFYINPVEEFDNSTGFSYIILQKSTTPITGDGSATDGSYITQTRLDKLLSSTNQSQVGYKIINYVGKTGEVTIYNKAKNLPTIQTFYYIYKRRNDDNTKYDKITSGWLGGEQENSCDIITNETLPINSDTDFNFENIFIQPNIGIKQDDYMPMKLSVYNKDYTKDIYLTNYYNYYQNNEWNEVNSNYSVINTLDDTMWKVICKNTEGELNSLYISDDSVQQPYALYEPQTQYKIYTNFVDSIPEGFFYSRYDKTIKFEIYDLNTYEEKEQIPYIVDNNIITYNGEKVDSIPYRDLYVKSVCQDYKLIDRSKYPIKESDNTNARDLNGEQYFVGSTWNNHIHVSNIIDLKMIGTGGSFKTTGSGAAFYGIGYDFKVYPNSTYNVSVIGENTIINIGLYSEDGVWKRGFIGVNSFTTNKDESWAIITISSGTQMQLTTYSDVKVNGKIISDKVKKELGTNYVTLKEYHFDVLTNGQKVVYSTEESYDGKYKLEFRGCNNNSTYYIKSYIEDNYGKLYTYQARIPIKYTETLSDTNINVTTMCEEQAIKVDFTPVRQIESSGSLIYNKPYADTNYNNNPLTFYEYDNNIVSIPSEFSYCVQFKLDSNIIDKNTRLKILEITTDNGNKYNLYFDTEAYFKVATNDGNKFAINKTYAKFILSNRDLANNENITKDSDDIKILDSKISDLIIPTQFAYIISNTQEVNNNYIYIMPSKVSDIYIDDQTNFKNTVPESCIDKSDKNKDILKLIGKDTFFVESNNENYINTNKVALTNMRDLIFTMTVKYDSTTKKYKITKATIS